AALAHLGLRGRKTHPQAILALGAPRPQAPLQLGHRGRREEHEDRAGHAVPDLPGSLDVDLEDHVVPAGAAGVPERWPTTWAHSRNAPEATSSSKRSSVTKR